MSESETEGDKMETVVGLVTLIEDLQQQIRMLDTAAEAPPAPATTYYDHPAVVEKFATLIHKVTELERLALLTTY